jgi:starch synthase
MRGFDAFQFDDFAGLCAGRTGGSIGHARIVAIDRMNSQPMPPRRSAATSSTPKTPPTPSDLRKPREASAADSRPRPSVLMIGSEALPFSKTGGLADVLGALPQALARLGWDVTLVVPRYRETTVGERIDQFDLRVGGVTGGIGLFEAPLGSARALLVDDPASYDRDHLYGTETGDYADNPRRFAVLVRAALEFAARRGMRPTIVHAHDWQAGLAPVYLKTLFATHPMLGGVPSVFTIHNMAYQGLFQPDWLPRLDLPWSLLGVEQLEYWGKISFLKGGINYADVVTTVSPQYGKEIQTPVFGAGFDGILQRRSADLVGILNGIDTTQWDPAHDAYLPKPFSATDPSGKIASKAAVLAEFGLPADQQGLARPLIGMISRMIDQKGFDLIAALADELVTLEAAFVVLGTGDPRYQDLWRQLTAQYPDRIAARIGFDERLAHLIEGGADLFLMPSRFEPCGLNQMYSLRYGTVPVVRHVGGLADTVVDQAAPSVGSVRPNGFVFQDYTPEALLGTLRRALGLFQNREAWRVLQVAGMEADHSWDRSAGEYVKIYNWAVSKGEMNGRGQRADVYGW